MIVLEAGIKFTNDSYTVYGNIEKRIKKGDYSDIISYTFDPIFCPFGERGGVKFTNNVGQVVWSDASIASIKKMVKEINEK